MMINDSGQPQPHPSRLPFANPEDVYNSLPNAVTLIDAQYRILWVNSAMVDTLGRKKEQIIGRRCYELIHSLDTPPDYCPLPEVLVSGNNHNLEICEKTLGGHCSVSVSPIRDESGRITGALHVARDINERKKNEFKLENSRSLLQTVIDGIPETILVIGSDYQVRMANKATLELYTPDGKLPATPVSCHRLTHNSETPCDEEHHLCPLSEVLASGRPATCVHHHTRADGSRYLVELTASPVFAGDRVDAIIEVGRDITAQRKMEDERKKLDSQILRQQKDESIATLAGGIAHDFNNLLMVVLGNSEILQMHTDPDDKNYEILDHIINSADRMSHLVRQLLAYAKGGKYLPSPLALPGIIEDSVGLARRGKAAELDVVMELPPDLWPILGDRGQISQAMVNIFTNGFEAMEQTGGSLHIQAANCIKKEPWECRQNRTHNAGDYVHIVVEDTGPGIPTNLHDKIFDPFFSTKFIGRGLGLSAASGIIQNHGGCLSLSGATGHGASFHILLPRLHEPEKGLSEGGKTTKDRTNTILAVDDDPQVLQLIEAILTDAGYMILTAGGGREAVDLFEDKTEAIGLVILDIQMPGMDGKEVFARLKSIKPEIPILISSGYDETTALNGLRFGPIDGYVPKPYRRSILLEKVQQCLGDDSSVEADRP